ncbi:hypothetical protein HNP84_003699 [Thermocatellispora tengchongensis]|uniref:Uncharacterized protein n=1 Tax=Thermocatellispora tengchongensis TaxID=1073253 RepID=A0A840P7S6_9ACTN|nr:hypothetical protein [Thermocatellispora tengchongensis]
MAAFASSRKRRLRGLTLDQWRAFHDGVREGTVLPHWDNGTARVTLPRHPEDPIVVGLAC